MRLVLALDSKDLALLQYPVIVEGWPHAAGRWACGSKKRKYLAAFTRSERDKLSKYHTLFYRWYVGQTPEGECLYEEGGVPQEFLFRIVMDIQLIQRAAEFFATV